MDIFSALGEPTRRDIIELLAQRGELPATEIYNRFRASHPAISQHLQVLHEAKLVNVQKMAQQRIYSLNQRKIFELESWAKRMGEEWEERLDALGALLEKEKRKTQKIHDKKR